MLNESVPLEEGKCKPLHMRYGIASERVYMVQYAEVTAKKISYTLQGRLLLRQQQQLAQLDTAVEAYLARFNAAKRERGEVPDIPGAAWAWERLLAFFAGEPTLAYTLRS